ncbi:Clp protease ClpP [Clostridium sp. D2Q-11]|uniref:ATP-dependent Clp protease proteolytic subunit n=1 Tax=Anaeromonas frigoriresistens TaxID=2683708 RepID=A0A942UVE3_9FIRM|nr:head maturation protease, ClpP-related [Anaeromonas frigoriresistens]MBS4538210.1 Clp protease ClpP [Anaeromonas frigoriresistens]
MRKINIKGAIVDNDEKWIYDWFEMDSTCPKEVEDELNKANGEEVEVIINSLGGSVFAGSEIYTLLKSYNGNTIGKIVGVAASAASIAGMGVNKLMISPTAEIMIHNVSGGIRGDYRDMEHAAIMLKDYNSTIANAYMIKSGMGKEELLDMMNKETWLTPEKSLEYKLVDEIMFMDNNLKLSASIGVSNIIPHDVINKMRNMKDKFNPTIDKSDIFMQQKAQAKLQLLKLKGEM